MEVHVRVDLCMDTCFAATPVVASQAARSAIIVACFHIVHCNVCTWCSPFWFHRMSPANRQETPHCVLRSNPRAACVSFCSGTERYEAPEGHACQIFANYTTHLLQKTLFFEKWHGKSAGQNHELSSLFLLQTSDVSRDMNGYLTPDDVTPFSKKKVWWNCEHGHKWKAVVASRSYGSGCPMCRNQKQKSRYLP